MIYEKRIICLHANGYKAIDSILQDFEDVNFLSRDPDVGSIYSIAFSDYYAWDKSPRNFHVIEMSESDLLMFSLKANKRFKVIHKLTPEEAEKIAKYDLKSKLAKCISHEERNLKAKKTRKLNQFNLKYANQYSYKIENKKGELEIFLKNPYGQYIHPPYNLHSATQMVEDLRPFSKFLSDFYSIQSFYKVNNEFQLFQFRSKVVRELKFDLRDFLSTNNFAPRVTES